MYFCHMNSLWHRVRLDYVCLLLIVVNFCSCKKTNINPIIEQTIQEFIPDQRVAFCNVTAHSQNGQIILSGETNLRQAKDSILARVTRQEVKVIDSIKVLPDSDFNIGVATLSVCNIRSKPKHSSELSTQALLGSKLNVFKKEGAWNYVQTSDGYLGWIDDNAIKIMDHMSFANWDIIPKVIFTQDVGLSYQDPSLTSSRVSDLVLGNILLFKGSKNGFIKVGYPDGRLGYVPSGSIVHLDHWKQNIEANPENILDMANRFLGRPYLWGGTSSLGFDCSGLTKTVYAQHGYLLPRDASQQALIGNHVETDKSLVNLNKGDLLFFGEISYRIKKRKNYPRCYLYG